MKNSYFFQTAGLLFLFIALLASCEEQETLIKGSGDLTRQRRNVQEFKEIDVNGILNVYLQQSETYKVEVKTDENLQDIVVIENSGDVLFIKTKRDVDYQATKMDVYIFVPDIERIELEGVNALFCKDTLVLDRVFIDKGNTGFMEFRATLNELTLNTYDIGDVELHGKAVHTVINNQMTGDLSAYGFKTENLGLNHGGTGEIEVYVTSVLDVEISGVGDVHCKGNPTEISKVVTGVGKLFMVD